ncbi:hypothetical protein EWF20_07275 [Sulfolobus sp. S-194]|uniref:hypothetical protein n=1 Tax=Sulfolobus sp. S-194 TaxID=2512240 RepID=UPI001436EF68|nr:hypothetical protein [Sulfolobus sp. S-194]QIW23970.1 hypothetical protein EWF20_07275 [Sulfolobus sp. S-194]
MLQVLWLLMNIEKTFDISWLDLITTNSEKEFGNKNEDYILVDLKDVKELLFPMMTRHLVFRREKIVAKSTVEMKILDLNPVDLIRELYRDNLNNSL